jgi:hypothetical protein
MLLIDPERIACDGGNQGRDRYDIMRFVLPSIQIEHLAAGGKSIDQLINVVLAMSGPPCDAVCDLPPVLPQQL